MTHYFYHRYDEKSHQTIIDMESLQYQYNCGRISKDSLGFEYSSIKLEV